MVYTSPVYIRNKAKQIHNKLMNECYGSTFTISFSRQRKFVSAALFLKSIQLSELAIDAGYLYMGM